MTTAVARPVAVDLKAILKTEGSSPSPTSSRAQPIPPPSHGQSIRHPGGPPPSGAPGPTIYPAYPPPGPPLQPAPGYAMPQGRPELMNYYSPRNAPGPPPPTSYVEPPHVTPLKRPPSQDPHPYEPAPKKQSKWTDEEDDQLITLRGEGMKWEEIAKHVPGRSAIACRLHYQNFLERRAAWDEEKKNKLAQLYNRSVNATGEFQSISQLLKRKARTESSTHNCEFSILTDTLTGSREKFGTKLPESYTCLGELWKRCIGAWDGQNSLRGQE